MNGPLTGDRTRCRIPLATRRLPRDGIAAGNVDVSTAHPCPENMSMKSVCVDISSENRGARAPSSHTVVIARNLARYSDESVFQLARNTLADLKSQLVISDRGGVRRAMPCPHTEQAVALVAPRDLGLSAPQPSPCRPTAPRSYPRPACGERVARAARRVRGRSDGRRRIQKNRQPIF